eukprot:TRINITY_DN10328_c0_g2_i2.p1 TRINITY_DN10328_c0_g2~~TRINITY_DN10328_c0_g2_i2.p1  ORF type:complete len:780 (-),score=103.68 TRINITY_DN10328_c0_g2_i2:223-2562(-)
MGLGTPPWDDSARAREMKGTARPDCMSLRDRRRRERMIWGNSTAKGWRPPPSACLWVFDDLEDQLPEEPKQHAPYQEPGQITARPRGRECTDIAADAEASAGAVRNGEEEEEDDESWEESDWYSPLDEHGRVWDAWGSSDSDLELPPRRNENVHTVRDPLSFDEAESPEESDPWLKRYLLVQEHLKEMARPWGALTPEEKKRSLEAHSLKEIMDEIARRTGTPWEAPIFDHPVFQGKKEEPVAVAPEPEKDTGLPLPPGSRLYHSKSSAGARRIQVRLPPPEGGPDRWLNSEGTPCRFNKSIGYSATATDHTKPIGEQPGRFFICTRWRAYASAVSYCWEWWENAGSKDERYADLDCPPAPTRAQLETPPPEASSSSTPPQRMSGPMPPSAKTAKAKASSSSAPPKVTAARAAGPMPLSATPAEAKPPSATPAKASSSSAPPKSGSSSGPVPPSAQPAKACVPRKSLPPVPAWGESSSAAVPRKSLPPVPLWGQSSSAAVPPAGQHVSLASATDSTVPAEPKQRRGPKRVLSDDEESVPRKSSPPVPAWGQSSSAAVPSAGQHVSSPMATDCRVPASKAGPRQEPKQRRRPKRVLSDDEESSSAAVPPAGQHMSPAIATDSTVTASNAGPRQEPKQQWRRLRRALSDDEEARSSSTSPKVGAAGPMSPSPTPAQARSSSTPPKVGAVGAAVPMPPSATPAKARSSGTPPKVGAAGPMPPSKKRGKAKARRKRRREGDQRMSRSFLAAYRGAQRTPDACGRTVRSGDSRWLEPIFEFPVV